MWSDGLRERLRADGPPALCVAFSGGPDSTALLHALAQLPEARERSLRALHVDHGLHADSRAWAERCMEFCASLNVPTTTVRVEVLDAHGEGIEAAARRARHAAFAEALREGEWLALAHHRDDQVETVLLKLLRGAGPEGLGGMRALRSFARGFLWRPLLDVPRTALRDYVAEHGLPCIDDPANSDPRFARNVLRNELLPRIMRHWPHADASILHAAQRCRAASDFISGEAAAALASIRRADDSLDADGWLALPEALRAETLHLWLRGHGLSTPGDRQYRELETQASTAAEDALPMVAWSGAQVRIWDGRLHAMPSLAALPENWQANWNGAPLALPADCGSLVLETTGSDSTDSVRVEPPLTVRFRRGGERIKPAGDAHTRELRDLFQQARVPPWLRERCPLVFDHDELIAVADLWVSERGKVLFASHGAKPHWMLPFGQIRRRT
ncbi:MAG: tRNA lysidine(34) synthetase TilS [Xanthomonadales bacterium]|nr:tRNA lysidine(34) synthetase TilS [Xanthomonadales bacterium]ODU94852.1 MAG: tRNA lysidine(34) synthetase TilS [Rhodanobacter sp. SCN 66-43]OJY82839.1 MAG: tRNA lysidine(34) synthetase TilS [Xanthomonadales bacterium 66-474]